jgi:hypothetical protein
MTIRTKTNHRAEKFFFSFLMTYLEGVQPVLLTGQSRPFAGSDRKGKGIAAAPAVIRRCS